MRAIPHSKFVALAELRHRIRQFLQGSEHAAEKAGLEPQQYQMLLALRALPQNHGVSIRQLADRLLLRHHSAVGLIDRLEARGYVRRDHNGHDLRQVSVILLPRGKRALEKVVRQRLHELRDSGHALVAAITAILDESKPQRGQRAARSANARKGAAFPRGRRTRNI